MRRRATTTGSTVLDVLVERVAHEMREGAPTERKRAARLLAEAGYSDRKISEVVGISRDTIRKDRTALTAPRAKRINHG